MTADANFVAGQLILMLQIVSFLILFSVDGYLLSSSYISPP